MSESHRLAHELDRVMRKIDARMHKLMPAVDEGRIGPMGCLLMMQLEAMQPCSIQSLATEMGRDNSQLTRLIRDLEAKGVLERSASPTDGRATLLRLTQDGEAFQVKAKAVLAEVVEDVVTPLDPKERDVLLRLLKQI